MGADSGKGREGYNAGSDPARWKPRPANGAELPSDLPQLWRTYVPGADLGFRTREGPRTDGDEGRTATGKAGEDGRGERPGEHRCREVNTAREWSMTKERGREPQTTPIPAFFFSGSERGAAILSSYNEGAYEFWQHSAGHKCFDFEAGGQVSAA